MIPKTFHYVWLGGPMPDIFRRWIDRAAALHPGWEIKIWRTIDLLENRRQAEQCKTYSGQSDVIRYEALRRFGGVYLDTDMLLLRNLEPLLNSQLVLCNSAHRRDSMASGFIAATPGHPRITAADAAIRQVDFSRRQFCGVQTGPSFFSRQLGDYTADPTVSVLPVKTFYPISYRQRQTVPDLLPAIEQQPPPGVYGIHAWDNSWSRKNGFV